MTTARGTRTVGQPTSSTVASSSVPTDWLAGFPTEGESFDPVPDTVNQCVQWYSPLLTSIARRYASDASHPLMNFDDLYQEATIGLLHAWHRYDPTRGSFPAFAQRCVSNAVMDYLRLVDPVPTHVRRHLRDLPSWFDRTARLRQPDSAEITHAAHSVGLSPDDLRTLNAWRFMHIISLDVVLDYDAVGEKTTDPTAVEATAMVLHERQQVLAVIDSWTQRSRHIFLESLVHHTPQDTLADYYGLTQPRISQIISRCWKDLRTQTNIFDTA